MAALIATAQAGVAVPADADTVAKQMAAATVLLAMAAPMPARMQDQQGSAETGYVAP
jgi:hypothetical protein